MKKKYITIKVMVEDHKRLKIDAAKAGISMMDMFSAVMNKKQYHRKGEKSE